MKKSLTTSTKITKSANLKFSKTRKSKIEKGAKDFAVRFEKVMKELAKG